MFVARAGVLELLELWKEHISLKYCILFLRQLGSGFL